MSSIPIEEALGTFANAFRVSQGNNGTTKCLLEFFVYSQNEGLACPVGKVSVSRKLLPLLRDTIRDIL